MPLSLLFISVIIPVYNGAETIGPCLESLLQQSYPGQAYDIVVVENGSTDDTSGVVGQYPVRLLHSGRRGPAAARNLGLANTRADIVAFTDADCVADANWLRELAAPYADPQVGGVGGTILAHKSPRPNPVDLFCEQRAPLINFISGEDEFLPHLYTANASYRRSLLDKVGGFASELVTAEDVDLAWRHQLRTGARLEYAPGAIIHHRHRSTWAGLARQYRQYGYGEIILDTLYGHQPGYPRGLRFQMRRIARQLAALPRYALGSGLRCARLAVGRATPYEAAVPRLQWLIETNNIRGKFEALVATRLMSDIQPVLQAEPGLLIARYFPSRKE